MIIDDNSPDKTSSEIKILKKIQKYFFTRATSKLGLDTAHKRGFDFALKNKYDYFITMDATCPMIQLKLKIL